ncbi:PHO85 cyclin-1 [Choanephora cucurbitarum]|uniref:PHO85 cyclin-1 n=1 Tax=Choanephora cucurbitarum TaxID=101091 RepID=A0A1C7N8X5_9FUNG|nr:PHO85 cyclin-1 [Choanephora cucurbitarum]
MSTINTTQIISRNPEALSAFTTLTVNSLLSCTNQTQWKLLPPLNEFISNLYHKKRLSCAVKAFALIYLLRLKSKLPVNARGGPDTPYRLFLAALLTSSKYLSESGTGLTSTQLASLVHHYSAREINRMERSFLGLLRYDLWVSNKDIQSFIEHYGHFIQIDIHHVYLPLHGVSVQNKMRCSLLDAHDTQETSASSNGVISNTNI